MAGRSAHRSGGTDRSAVHGGRTGRIEGLAEAEHRRPTVHACRRRRNGGRRRNDRRRNSRRRSARPRANFPKGHGRCSRRCSDGRWLGVFVGGKGLSFAAFGPPPAHEEPSRRTRRRRSRRKSGRGRRRRTWRRRTRRRGHAATRRTRSLRRWDVRRDERRRHVGAQPRSEPARPSGLEHSGERSDEPRALASATLARVKILSSRAAGRDAQARAGRALVRHATYCAARVCARSRRTDHGARRITVELAPPPWPPPCAARHASAAAAASADVAAARRQAAALVLG